jgi:Leucine Rich repeat
MVKTSSKNPLKRNQSSEDSVNKSSSGFIADLIGHEELIHCFKSAEKYYKKLTKQSEIVEDENAILLISEHLNRYNKNQECNRRIAEAVINLWSLDNKNVKEQLRNAIFYKGLTELDLKYSYLGSKETEKITALLPFTSLTFLNLAYNSIGVKGAKALATNSTLTKLNLWGNEIGNEGAKALAINSSLTMLNLGKNKIYDEGAKALAANSTLIFLNLCFNNIGDEGVKAFADNSTLTRLNLNANSFTDEGAKKLSTNLTLIEIDVKYNFISFDIRAALTEKDPVKRYKNSLAFDVKISFPSLLILSIFSMRQDKNKQKIINLMKKWGTPFEDITKRLKLE